VYANHRNENLPSRPAEGTAAEIDGIDAVELINFVNVATTKTLVFACQRRSDGVDYDNTDE
jgi:hypothetical protein